jgi:hypothetical protein
MAASLRDGPDPGPADPAVTRRRLSALLVGAAIGVAYVLLAGAPGLPGRPLYDGFAPPPPYRWVSPPLDLADGNQEPEGVTYPIALQPNGSGVAAVTTPDLQVSLVFQPGAIAFADGQSSAEIAVSPQDPGVFGAPPAGLEIRGNVYQVGATYQPGGTPVPAFDPKVQVALAYPAPANPAGESREVLFSTDGQQCTRLESIDSPAQHKVGADLAGPGYLAVGGPSVSAAPDGEGGLGRFLLPAIIILAGLLAIGLAFYLWSGRSLREE